MWVLWYLVGLSLATVGGRALQLRHTPFGCALLASAAFCILKATA